MKKSKKLLIKMQMKVQATYIITFIICIFGIVGNVELGVKTPTANLILTFVTGLLTVMKFINFYKEEMLWQKKH